MDSLAVKAYTCKCGHQAELHPFDEWSPQEEDGSCAMCDCRSFSPKHLFWWLFFAPVVKVILILLILIFFMVGMCVNVTPILPPESTPWGCGCGAPGSWSEYNQQES